jgi:hypothetical protein
MNAFRAVDCYSTARVQAVAQENKTDHERWSKLTSTEQLTARAVGKMCGPELGYGPRTQDVTLT